MTSEAKRLGEDAPGEDSKLSQVTATDSVKLFSAAGATLETNLIGRIAQGDHEAFGALYDRYSECLFSLAISILNDSTEAEDVLQEAFLKIWEKARFFDGALGKSVTWALAVTRNKAIDRVRARQRRLRVFEENAAGSFVDEVAGSTQPVENFRHDEVAQIRTLLEELSWDQRRAIELAFFGGWTQLEIATALAEPLGTIKARIRRGLSRLRDGLGARI